MQLTRKRIPSPISSHWTDSIIITRPAPPPLLVVSFLKSSETLILKPPIPMAGTTASPASGYCAETKTYRSLHPAASLPDESRPLSVTSYALSLLPSPLPSNPAIVDAVTGARISYPEFLAQIRALASALRSRLGIAKGDVAFVLAPSSFEIPVIYHALLSVGSVVSPANPASTAGEISRQLQLSRPAIAFATSDTARNLPAGFPTVLIDSPLFRSFLAGGDDIAGVGDEVYQSDAAAILYSSGTTGKVKGVVLSHRNFVALIAGYYESAQRQEREGASVALFTVPLFHVFGFFMLIRAAALGETTVLMGRFELGTMLRAIEAHKVTYMPVSPPLVVAMVKSGEVDRYDLSSLQCVGCGGAPLGKEVADQFKARFPHVEVFQGYGLTESAGSVSSTTGPDDPHGSVGQLSANMEAKVVDPTSGKALPPGRQGELLLRGPTIMKGYIGDDEATASTFDSEGWLKTGDICYFNQDGILFIVDRLKELIKYKAYQVPPAELEHILQSHPEIADAAVIPYPHEEAGQIPMAYVVRQPGSTLNEEQVMDFVAQQVAPYKKVRRVAFTSSIPKSAAGKILRRELVNHALSIPTSKL